VVEVRCRFGEFELDAAARQLRGRGAVIHLSRKAFDLLNILVARRPTVVPKDALYKELWPDTYVTDANLMVLVGEVRRALGDQAHASRFIRTVHGVGYAFCGEADDLDGQPPAPPPARMWLVDDQRSFVLSEGDNVIGRDPQCAVWLDDDSVSRRHACVRAKLGEASALLEDLHSTNGTFVGRRRVNGEIALSDGDVVKVGSVTLEFRSLGAEQPPTKRIRSSRRIGR
jgi:DNA-binding winged helix-turn-helix (wHTH) protein